MSIPMQQKANLVETNSLTDVLEYLPAKINTGPMGGALTKTKTGCFFEVKLYEIKGSSFKLGHYFRINDQGHFSPKLDVAFAHNLISDQDKEAIIVSNGKITFKLIGNNAKQLKALCR